MATIKEDFVSFETAKLLKEKGFDEPCECAYSEKGQYLLSCYKGVANRRIKNSEALDFSYSVVAPTLQMAMKWLREVHSLHIWIGHNNKKGLPWYYEIHNIKIGMVAKIGGVDCGSYETACEEAIKHCLENLV